MSELEKEARLKIDKQLKEAGWEDLNNNINNKTGFVREFPTGSGPVDYALLISGHPIAIIEAKKASKDAYSALTQAERYAETINAQRYQINGFNIPFILTTNSEEIWFRDLRQDAPMERSLRFFHTPEALKKIFKKDYSAAKKWLQSTNIKETDKDLWDNQVGAIKGIEKALIDNKRRALAQMATGTGKTRMAIAQTYRLLKSKYVDKVLFLADRTKLSDQATENFENYDVGGGRKLGEVYSIKEVKNGSFPEDADIVTSTLQAMYSLLENHDEIDIPPHAFDLVISDECHRSIYGDWRVVLNHFDAIQIGLTATPATQTVSYFKERGDWVYSYGYWDAVDDGHVVPYETYRIETGFRMDGIDYNGEHYDPSEIENKITVPSTNRKIVKEFRENSKEDQKTLVFATNDNHAKELEKIFREVYSDKGSDYIRKITYTTDNPDNWLRRFQHRKNPMIAVTVDMVSTGVDVKPIENLLFVRPTRSPILYNQMIGRGTRTCESINKEKFTIYDCVGVVEYFKNQQVPPFNTYRPKSESVDKDKNRTTQSEDKEITVADDIEDEITFSGYTFTTEDGEELKPDDYITRFEKYINENKHEIDALQVILKSPKDLKRSHIKNLSEKLRSLKEKFTEEKLQKAYKQELVDLIGFVEHALGRDDFPTTEERINKAFKAWKQDKEFTEQEEKWLKLIKDHFVQNKTIKKQDFYMIPFSRKGGWSQAKQVFGGEEKLESVLQELNNQVLV